MRNKTAMIPEGSIARRPTTPRRLKTTVLAAAAALALLGVCFDAQAVALGAASAKSYLGQPLRAEIEVPEISSEEAASFKAAIASRQAFQTANVEYSQALAGARVSLHRRANGQAYLRVEGDRPVDEPFLGLVIDAQWGKGGRIVRDYTLLVDPQTRPAPTPPPVNPSQVNPPKQGAAVPPPPAEIKPRRAAASAAPAAAASASAAAGGQITVKRGDTAMAIVSAHPIDGVSLDQMLIALLRANPHAFIRGNVNLMKTGAVLDLPTAAQASATTPKEARRAFVAQVHEFNTYRTGVARNVHNVPAGPAGQQAGGKVKPVVREGKAPAAPGDQLVMEPAGGASKAGAAAVTAKQRQIDDQRKRQEEIERNIAESNRLAEIASAASQPAPGASVPEIVVPIGSGATPPPVEPSASGPAPEASAPASDASAPPMASASEEAAPPAVVKQPPKPPRPAPPPPRRAEPSLMDQLSDNALPILGVLALLVLIVVGVIWRVRAGRKKSAPADSSFIESRLQPDSFFGASGGQHVNTRDAGGAAGANSSLAYSPSQLDAAGDIDPVAEADVYLAYGRDQQAEEILKEALRTHAGRVAIHRKLAEIYAKRRDPRALQTIAAEAFDLTRGSGPDWQAIAALGNELDAGNPLYAASAGAPAPRAAPAAAPVRGNFGADTQPASQSDSVPPSAKMDLERTPTRGGAAIPPTMPMPPLHTPDSAPVDLDLGLDEAPVRAAPQAPDSRPVDLDLGLNFTPPPEPAAPPARPQAAAPRAPAAPAARPAAATATGGKPGMIEFDLSASPADADSRPADLQTRQPPDIDSDPLGTKLALAQEFHAIGDNDGARSLVKEVIAEATGSLKSRAERFLAELG